MTPTELLDERDSEIARLQVQVDALAYQKYGDIGAWHPSHTDRSSRRSHCRKLHHQPEHTT